MLSNRAELLAILRTTSVSAPVFNRPQSSHFIAVSDGLAIEMPARKLKSSRDTLPSDASARILIQYSTT